MKKLLLISQLFIATIFCCTASRAAETDTISFRVTQNTADYVVAAVQDADIQVAIATAFLSVTDSNASIPVVVTEGQVVRILKAITLVPEGVAAEPNKELLNLLKSSLPGRPWLAGQLVRVLNQNDRVYKSLVTTGREKRSAIAAGIKRN